MNDAPGKLTWFVCTDPAGLQRIWPAWERLAGADPAAGFYLAPSWLQAVVELTPDAAQGLHVVCIADGEDIVAIAPFVIRPGRTRLYRTRCLRLLGNIYSARRGFPVAQGYESAVATRLAGILVDDLGESWDLLQMEDIPEHDPFVRQLLAQCRALGAPCRATQQYGVVHTRLAGFASGGDLLASLSKNLRQKIRQYLRKLNKAGTVQAVLCSEPGAELESALADYRTLYDLSWKEAELYPDFHSRFGQRMARDGRLRLFLLYLVPGEQGGELSVDSELAHSRPEASSALPVAAYYFIIHRDVAYFLKTVYDPAWREASPGTVLFWFALRHLLEVDHCVHVDHQKGVEPYKLRWGELHGYMYRFTVWHPRRWLLRFEAWVGRTVRAVSGGRRAGTPG